MPNIASFSLRALCAAALLVPACTSEDSPDTLTETTQDLTTTSTITTRGVNTTANVLDDWGTGKQISAALVTGRTLKVRYCAAHFPATSQALANLKAALTAYSAVPGVAIDITDIAAQPSTTTHPNLTSFTLPADTIYVDYDALSEGYAATLLPNASCDSSSPKQCTKARIYITDGSPGFLDPMVVAEAPSVGVFMHELGHVFGMGHLNEDDDSRVLLNPSDMWFDRTTIHGHKTQATDFRSNVIQAGTLGFLRAYYSDTSPGLQTDEIVAHRNMSVVDGSTHIEFNPSKSYQGFGTANAAIADKNETKLRWSATADVGGGVLGGFEPCSAPGTLPRWFARMSETSTNTLNKAFQSVFEVTNTDAGTSWSQVASTTFNSYVAGQADLRQIDWERTFPLSAAALGVSATGVTSTTYRKLRFRADATNALVERNEANNEWQVNICLYAATDTSCAAPCAEP